MWINTRCENNDNDECVCPRCKYARKRDTGWEPNMSESLEWIEKLNKWDNRSVELEINMRKRFPKEEE